MGLLQKACETYDCMAERAGREFAGEAEPLAPVSHIMARAQIEITLDQDGRFVTARSVDKQEPKIVIPATEESAGRTIKAAELPHPLCDYLRYLLPYNKDEYSRYVSQLSNWANSAFSTPKLHAVLKYVQGGTVISDLTRSEIIQLDQNGKPGDEKLLVRWVVNGLGEVASGPCWTDQALMKSFVEYYASVRSSQSDSLCMISGTVEPPASQHPKGIVPINGNAKLISANDSNGFTYRGRFDTISQAVTVGYTASQKAHNALRWLIANQGVLIGGRTFLSWNPQGIQLPRVTGPMGRRNGTGQQKTAIPTEYRQQLKEALSGWKESLPTNAGVVIAAFDAATTGRLALTYYHELPASDFLQRLHDWEESCCWENGDFGIQSPSLFSIVNLAFGVPRNGKVETDDRILRQQIQRLTACRIDCANFPLDVKRALLEKASNLITYERDLRSKLLFTACAVIRKYHIDHLKEEWNMALDKENTDRSYLFGRLLAIAEIVEHRTYKQEESRETNALRMQKAFTLRPLSTWRILEEKLEPYYKQLPPKHRQHYRRLTEEIVGKLSASSTNLNQKLDDIYLLGYYHQRAYRSEPANRQETE